MAIPAYIHKIHPRARRMTLKVNPRGEVVVVTPRFTPEWSIKQFVQAHTDWISQQVQKIEHQLRARSTNTVLLFGKHYEVQLDTDCAHTVGVRIAGTTVVVTPQELSASLTNQAVQDQLDRFYKRTARSYILPRTAQMSQVMGIEYAEVRLKQQQSRWGSCSSDGNLNFNWRLVHCPPEVIDYVIIHELAHRTHMDHSRSFWQLVSQYDPAYQRHRGWLKREGRYLV